jgi:hypothetical protein
VESLITQLETELQNKNKNIEAANQYIRQGNTYKNQGLLEQAIDNYQKSLSYYPNPEIEKLIAILRDQIAKNKYNTPPPPPPPPPTSYPTSPGHTTTITPADDYPPPSDSQKGSVIYDNGNISGVYNSPTHPTRFTTNKSYTITLIQNYHWNNSRGNSYTGTIALKGDNGKLYGSWQTSGSPGQGGVPNAYWKCYPNITIPAGTYTVIDSDPSTWSQNSQSNGAGHTRIEGYSKDSGITSTYNPPPVEVSQAITLNFIGKYTLTDPSRTFDKYHGFTILENNGQGWSKEFQNNKPISLKYPETQNASGYVPIQWSFNKTKKKFIFDWTLNGKLKGFGYFEGTITGNTNSFTLKGNWSNGSAGQLHFDRTQ